ncbi:Glucans biosynthesis glucosyltransferase H [wastewater metagenome]|uniref:Glucans biosynthesis glucosyltransferase H n=3 Tax=root TaxID=1 RepID=A0A5B8RBT0_9ZZZZ|nr:glucans biosynthesis glucosyltransferase H [uncultured organism]
MHSPEASTSPVTDRVHCPGAGLRRAVFALLVLSSAAGGVFLMFSILRANDTTILEWGILALFTVTFTWIVAAFWSAVAGFVLSLARRHPLTLAASPVPDSGPTGRVAVVMPVYNEDPGRVLAGLEATWHSLVATGAGERFDFHLLSDTRDEAIAEAEAAGCAELAERLDADGRLFYRRRDDNAGRKAGNIADFCRRWGGRYDFMVVLDADSVMSGDALLALARTMWRHPSAGIIQTVPIPVRQRTPFGRFLQFAARLYSPMLATGLSFWQMDAANYWGHNAIIRVRAFSDCCGLPALPGRPPLGGDILSHDFVEAALMRRGGWHVYLLPEIEGSYEEVPSNLLDFAKRDRRWAQGNLQHLRLLAAYGLHPLSRVHFLMGATAYISSLLWLFMLALSTVDALTRALNQGEFFRRGYQLFPDWPVAKTTEIASLLMITVALLLLPKVLGVLRALLRADERRAFGGGWRLAWNALTETVFSVLIAPVMMVFHAGFVLAVLSGSRTGWDPQVRDGRAVAWREAARRTALATIGGLLWGGVTAWLALGFFWWLTPIVAGLVLAAPIVVCSSRLDWGEWMVRSGTWAAPEERRPPAVLGLLDTTLAAEGRGAARRLPALPPERPLAMPVQSLERGAHWRRTRVRLS